jgi:hypothetical protein
LLRNDASVLPKLVTTAPAGWAMLPPGIHEATLQDIRASFVEGIESCRRKPIFEDYLAWREAIRGLVVVEREFIDGSFVTDRANPSDIDVSFWVAAWRIEALSDSQYRALNLLTGDDARAVFNVDAYLVPAAEVGEMAYDDFVAEREKTEDAWATAQDLRRTRLDRGLVEKGFVELVTP